jgi:hypothetical protein
MWWQNEREGKKSVLQGVTPCRLDGYRRFGETTAFLNAGTSTGLHGIRVAFKRRPIATIIQRQCQTNE